MLEMPMPLKTNQGKLSDVKLGLFTYPVLMTARYYFFVQRQFVLWVKIKDSILKWPRHRYGIQ